MQIYLQENTIKKIFREQFRGETPITIPSEPSKVSFLAELKTLLSTRPGFKVSYLSLSKELTCCFTVISSLPDFHDQGFCVGFNDNHELTIAKEHDRWVNSPVYQLEQIYTLVEKMPVEYERLNKLRVKRANDVLKQKKIKDLKHAAILAKIHEIAKEDKFEFLVDEYKTKVKLVVRLTKLEQIEIDIPYSRFQETLKNLRDTISMIRTFYELGLTFRVRSYFRRRDPNWIRYD